MKLRIKAIMSRTQWLKIDSQMAQYESGVKIGFKCGSLFVVTYESYFTVSSRSVLAYAQ